MNVRVKPIDRHLMERIKQARVESGCRLAHVAKHLGLTYQSYRRYEGEGKGVVVPAATLVSLSQFYGVPVAWFFEDAPAVFPNADEIGTVVNTMKDLPPEIAGEVVRYVQAVSRGQ